MGNLFFNLNTEEQENLKKSFGSLDNYISNDEKEISYYNNTMAIIKDNYENKCPGWFYWSRNFSGMNWELLFKEPYFGSVGLCGQTRSYIGKQRLYDVVKEKIIVHDWRSSFGDLFYRKKEITFIENRLVAVEDIRRYIYKYVYINELDDYNSFLNQVLANKKASFLSDVVQTIDEIQNDIIRSIDNKYEIIDGGPGTGKTTIGLHILSFKSYKYLKNHKSYPKIIIIVSSEVFKKYISEALINLDLYGRNYHNTQLYSFDEFKDLKEKKCDYAFIDESQDFDECELKKIIDETEADNFIFCYDKNQRISDEKQIDLVDIFSSNNYPYRIRKITNNYRNTHKLIAAASKIISNEQTCMSNMDSKLNFALWNDFFDPRDIIINNIISHENLMNAIIYLDEKSKNYVKELLAEKHITFFEEVFFTDENDIIFILTPTQAKGFEFDNVIVVGNDIVLNNIKVKRELYVSITRSLSDLLIVSNNYIEEIQFDNELYPEKTNLEIAYFLFSSGFIDKAVSFVNGSLDDFVLETTSFNYSNILSFLRCVVSNKKEFVDKKLSDDSIRSIFSQNKLDIISELIGCNVCSYIDLFMLLVKSIDKNIEKYIVDNSEEFIKELEITNEAFKLKTIEKKQILSVIKDADFQENQTKIFDSMINQKVISYSDIICFIIETQFFDLEEYIIENMDKFFISLNAKESNEWLYKIEVDLLLEEIVHIGKKIDIRLMIDYLIKSKVLNHMSLFKFYINKKYNVLYEYLNSNLKQLLVNSNEELNVFFIFFDHSKIVNILIQNHIHIKNNCKLCKILLEGQYCTDKKLFGKCISSNLFEADTLLSIICKGYISSLINFYELMIPEMINEILKQNFVLIDTIKENEEIKKSIYSYLFNNFALIKLLKIKRALK